ncbi:MAG: adenine phosphoribosyltransferase, partial [Pseudomonadota bacterium]|nr:adenine phosphoribosyltransferase [Pseudomonadota bacterium]
MSINAATSATTENETTPMLNTDHPFWQIIRTVPDFPKVGIDFYDITPLLRSHIDAVIDALLAALPEGLMDEVDCLGAVEARG